MDAKLRTATVEAFEELPGLVHGFELRSAFGGPESREDAHRRLTRALARHGRLYLLAQVHGAAVHIAPWEGRPEGDAGLAGESGLIVGVETADCLPILLVDPVGRRAAAVHAGWRGTLAGISGATVAAMAALGTRETDVIAALGPAIGACCYEVGNEMREAFGCAAEGCFLEGPRGRPHLDLRAVNVRQLLSAGLVEGRIHHVADCTSCRADQYFSFRRDGKGTGRMVNFVGWTEEKRARSS